MISLSLGMPLSVVLACFQGHRVWTENSLPCSVYLTGLCVELCLFISIFVTAGFECHKVSERQYCTLCHLHFICSYSAKCVCVCVCVPVHVCVIYCFYFTLLVLHKTCWFNIKACHKTHTWKIQIYVWFCETKQKNHLQSLCFSCVFCHWKRKRKRTDCYPFSLFKGGNCSKAAVRCNVPILNACSLSICLVYAWFGCELLAYLHFVLTRFN